MPLLWLCVMIVLFILRLKLWKRPGIAVGQETGQTESPEKEEVVQQPYSVQELTRMLDEAVRNEEYEKASKIRDLLKEMGK